MGTPVDFSSILTPEQAAAIAAAANAPGVNYGEEEIEEPALMPSFGNAPAGSPMSVQLSALSQKPFTNNLPKPGTKITEEPTAEGALRSRFQQMLDTQKKALEKERTTNLKLAAVNSLGRAMRTMVQPLGWAVGGATAPVPKYDDRNYIEAFNRAVKAGDDLRNLGTAEQQFELNLAQQNYRNNLANEAYKQRREMELETARVKEDIKTKGWAERAAIKAMPSTGEKKDDTYQRRLTNAIHDWTLHDKGMTLSQYLRMVEANDKNYFGGRMINQAAIAEIEKEVAEAKKATTPAKPTTGITTPGGTTFFLPGQTQTQGLTLER